MHIEYSILHELQLRINDKRSQDFIDSYLALGEFEEFDVPSTTNCGKSKVTRTKEQEFVTSDVLAFETSMRGMQTIIDKQVQESNAIMTR